MAARGGAKPPYHPGELEVQRRAGVADDAQHLVGMVQPRLHPRAVPFLAQQSVAVATSVDTKGRPWASLLTGPQGFVKPVDEAHLLLAGSPPAHDPLAANLAAHSELGLLVIDVATRRRLRFNGRGVVDPARGILLSIEQSYGNCPKYIHPRRVDVPPAASKPKQHRTKALSRHQQTLIASADTFFIASVHPTAGPDASHRGGSPGFVHVLDDRTLEFPDYPGNNMFNTLGNLTAEPRTGLLFLDFETGDTLQIAGRATLDWSAETLARHPGAEHVVVSVKVEEVLQTEGTGLKGRLLKD